MEDTNIKIIRTAAGRTIHIMSLPQNILKEIQKAQEAALREEKYAELEGIEKELDPVSQKIQEMLKILGTEAPVMREIAAQEEPRSLTPEGIKRRIKYAKNPLQVIQLNRQLGAKSKGQVSRYGRYRKKKHK